MKGFVSKINEKFIFLILTLFFFSSFLYFLITNTYSPYYSKSLLFFIIAAIVTIVLYVWPYLLKAAKKTKYLSSLKHLSLVKKRLKNRTEIIQKLFEYSLIAYLAVLIIGEFTKIEIISDILLVATIILGILALIFPKKNKKEKKKFPKPNFYETSLITLYGLIFIVAILFETNNIGLNIDYLFLVFIAISLPFPFLKIDSRYLIFVAILFLWLCPFLLLYNLNANANDIAVFAYYFLVIGVVMQIIDTRKNHKTNLDFSEIKKIIHRKYTLLSGLAVTFAYFLGMIIKIAPQYESLTFYAGTTLLALWASKYFVENGTGQKK